MTRPCLTSFSQSGFTLHVRPPPHIVAVEHQKIQKRYRKISIYTGEPLLRLERCKNWYDAEYSHCTAAIPDRLRWG